MYHQYDFFCDEITKSVENKIFSWCGCNKINYFQALKLLRYGYMLGGFIIVEPMSLVLSLLFTERIYDGVMVRDLEGLSRFHLTYRNRYEICPGEQELELLRT